MDRIMLKEMDFDKLPQTYADDKTKHLGEEFDKLQRELQAKNIPVLILLEGWESSGKGHILNDLAREMDPRYVRVEVFEETTEEEESHQTSWRYWQRIPSRQEIVIYDRSFYNVVLNDRKIKEKDLQGKIQELKNFETMLTDDGYIVIKYFLHVTEDRQKKRIKELEKSEYQEYLLDDIDYDQNNHYDKYLKHFEEVLELTNSETHPWHIINAQDLKLASKQILGKTMEIIREAVPQVEAERRKKQATNRDFKLEDDQLDKEDLSRQLTKEEYHEIKDDLQERAAKLVYECYTKGIPIVLAFEGVDAAGKGGAIQRLTREIDPRSYKIFGIKAPTQEELDHHYLWRFQTKFPQDGQMRIFDRSWYGRVLVERIEGFASEKEWERAYQEINQMEKELTDHGTILMKFFLYIDKDEQAARFEDRQEDPDKNYKITDEDWRNREKWDAYELAYEEMLARTSKDQAPWYVVGTNQKYFARIQVLKTFIAHVEKYLDQL